MIDLRRRSVDYKEFIGAELILAAAVIVIGVCVQGGPAGWFIGPGNGGGSSASQVSAAEVKQDEEETSESAATSRETAAETARPRPTAKFRETAGTSRRSSRRRGASGEKK